MSQPRESIAAARFARATGAGILKAATPRAWVEAAAADLPTLLVDHANCEKKAASTAMALIFAYPEDRALAVALSRLAREELKHFEQVERLMRKLALPHLRLKPGRYAGELRKLVRTHEPKRKLDLMIVHALIEARSCERFRLLSAQLPESVGELYAQLERSEARHFELYLQFAEREFDAAEIAARLDLIAQREAELATSPDEELRFHSGPVINAAAEPRARHRR
jgi:tRNA-(ms[2]io[6]A)-hydroxylase